MTIRTFTTYNNKPVRAVAKGSNVYLLAKDVCNAVGLKATNDGYVDHLGCVDSVVESRDLGVSLPFMNTKAKWVPAAELSKVLANSNTWFAIKFKALMADTLMPTMLKDAIAKVSERTTVTVQDFAKLHNLNLTHEQRIRLGAASFVASRRAGAAMGTGKVKYGSQVNTVKAHRMDIIEGAARKLGLMQ